MIRYCPYCNNELSTNGNHARIVIGCNYKGPGLSRQEVIDQADGYELGDTTGDRNNGAGCYDNDTDMS